MATPTIAHGPRPRKDEIHQAESSQRAHVPGWRQLVDESTPAAPSSAESYGQHAC